MADEKKLDELRAAHGDVHAITMRGITVYVREPGHPEFVLWRAASADDKRRLTAGENLFRRCVVHVEGMASLDELFDRKPFLALEFVNDLLEIAGINEKSEVKKL